MSRSGKVRHVDFPRTSDVIQLELNPIGARLGGMDSWCASKSPLISKGYKCCSVVTLATNQSSTYGLGLCSHEQQRRTLASTLAGTLDPLWPDRTGRSPWIYDIAARVQQIGAMLRRLDSTHLQVDF